MIDTQNLTTEQIKDLLQKLNEQKQKLETTATIKDIVQAEFNKNWAKIESRQIKKFDKLVEDHSKVFYLELALIEAFEPFIDERLMEDIKKCLPNVRHSDDLGRMNGVYLSYNNDVKVRQTLKLFNALYRYNRTMLTTTHHSERKELHVYKSRIKHASLCPHCGETARVILERLRQTQLVTIP